MYAYTNRFSCSIRPNILSFFGKEKTFHLFLCSIQSKLLNTTNPNYPSQLQTKSPTISLFLSWYSASEYVRLVFLCFGFLQLSFFRVHTYTGACLIQYYCRHSLFFNYLVFHILARCTLCCSQHFIYRLLSVLFYHVHLHPWSMHEIKFYSIVIAVVGHLGRLVASILSYQTSKNKFETLANSTSRIGFVVFFSFDIILNRRILLSAKERNSCFYSIIDFQTCMSFQY